MLIIYLSKDRRERKLRRGFDKNRKRFFGGGSGGGSSAPTSTTTVQKADPWEGQKPYLEKLFQRADTAYGEMGKDQYSGKLIADVNANQQAVNTNRLALADRLTGAGDSLYNLGQRTAAGDYLNPSSNPALQASIEAGLNPVMDKFKTEIIPGISSAAIEQGAYGGARHGLALSQAAQGATREMSDIAGKIAYENYARERAAQMQAGQLIGTGAQMMDMPNTLREGVGNLQQIWEQDQLDQAYQQYTLQQQAPWIGIPEYAGIIQNGQFGSSSSGSANMSGMTGPSRVRSALSGGLGGAALGGLGAYGLMQAGAINAWNPVGWGMMAGGALLGGLSGGLGS